MSKTLGQIHIDAYQAGPTGEKGAHAIAAVARHVFTAMMAERDAATRDIGKAMESYKPAESRKPEAGDWAMEWWGQFSGAPIPAMTRQIIDGMKQAAERHYGAMVDALKEAATTAIQECDAARAEVERLQAIVNSYVDYMNP